jgi:hypothetical protein
MRRKTSFVNRLTQRPPMRRIDQTCQVHNHVLTASHLIAYVSFQDDANIERRIAHVVTEALDIPILPSRIGAVTSAGTGRP